MPELITLPPLIVVVPPALVVTVADLTVSPIVVKPVEFKVNPLISPFAALPTFPLKVMLLLPALIVKE